MRYKEWLNIWLDCYVKVASKQRTLKRYTQVVKSYLIPQLGEYEMEEIQVLHLQNFIVNLLNEGNLKSGGGLKESSVNVIITIMQNSLKTAYLSGVVNRYIGDKIKRPKIEQEEVKCFSIEEQKKIETAVLSDKKNKTIGVILCLYTGMRIGELFALTWKDINFKNSLLNISKSSHYGKIGSKYKKIIEKPKTKSSIRQIPLPKPLLEILKNMKKTSKSIYVITDNGKEVSIRSYQRRFKVLLQKLNISYKSFHALRHTFATRAIECGMDVKTLSEILGHKSATITLNRYVHSLISYKKQMMNKVGGLLKITSNMVLDT